MTNKSKGEAMSSIGAITAFGSDWYKAGLEKAFFTNLEELYGLKFQSSESGRITQVTLDGEHIELAEAMRLRGKLALGKVWFDFENLTFGCRDLEWDLAKKIIDEITRQVVEANYHG